MYHTTSSLIKYHSYSLKDPRKFELELKEDMVNKTANTSIQIINYMRSLYKKEGLYKISSGMVYEYLKKENPRLSKSAVYSCLSLLKGKNTIQRLDEPVPNSRGGAKYYVLTEILDKITAPNTSGKSDSVTIPIQSKTTPMPKNPFDTINPKLDDIVIASTHILEGIEELKKLNWQDSVSKEFAATVAAQVLEAMPTTVSSGTSDKSDDYREGIKAGIRLAVEMGLSLPKDG